MNDKSLSSQKKLLFTFTALLLPFLFFFLAEGLLRLSGVEKERQNLFIPAPDQDDYVVINPFFGKRYFTGFQPETAPQPFLKTKPADTFRFFVLGGSSAAGFPYQYYHGFPAYLQEMLQAENPGRHIEVINLAMTAVNSYTIWDIHKKLLRYEPDGILLYAGHNEYYGAYGAATVPGWMKPRWVRHTLLRLQRLHIVSRLSAFFDQDGRTARHSHPEARTLMARMATERYVYKKGKTYDLGIRHFSKNITDILRTFEKAGVSVYISTVVSNKTGQKPLVAHKEADHWFEKGHYYLQQQNTDSARICFLRAKEHDPLRFRSPETINRFIRDLDGRKGVTLIDAHQLLTKNDLPLPFDNSFFVDHLHLDYRGYALIARAFHSAIYPYISPMKKEADYFPGVEAVGFGVPGPLEKMLVNYTLGMLMSDFPFVREPGKRNPEAYQNRMLRRYRLSEDRAEKAAYQFISYEQALPDILARLAGYYHSEGKHIEAVRTLRALHYLQPLNPELDRRIINFLLGIPYETSMETIFLMIRLAGTRFDAQLWPAITSALIRNHRLAEAEIWLRAWENHQSPNAEWYRLYAQWHINQGNTAEAQSYFREYYRRIRE